MLDARDPMGTRSRLVEKYLRTETPHKHLVFVLNKVSVVSHHQTRPFPALHTHTLPTNTSSLCSAISCHQRPFPAPTTPSAHTGWGALQLFKHHHHHQPPTVCRAETFLSIHLSLKTHVEVVPLSHGLSHSSCQSLHEKLCKVWVHSKLCMASALTSITVVLDPLVNQNPASLEQGQCAILGLLLCLLLAPSGTSSPIQNGKLCGLFTDCPGWGSN